MLGRIVEVASNGRYLHAHRGFMIIDQGSIERARIPLDEIAAVIGNAHGLTWSNELLVRLSERGSPVVVVDAQHRPTCLILSLSGNHRQGLRLVRQTQLKAPDKKRLWKRLVQAKLLAQARTLEAYGIQGTLLRRLARGVKSGDPDNREAQGARAYWRLLMGPDFRRDPNADGINSLLNFGYTILRTCVARSIVAAGLHPTLGLKHCNEYNAAALADDLMEPFRPVVDATVRALSDKGLDSICKETKRALALSMYRPIPSDAGQSPMVTAIQRLAVSLAMIVEGLQRNLELPGEISRDALRDPGSICGNEDTSEDE